MKKYLVFFLLLLCSTIAHAQMSDQQVLKFIQQEQKAGTSQGQIVIKLQQRGVKVEQIQRLRRQYDQQLKLSLRQIPDCVRTMRRNSS